MKGLGDTSEHSYGEPQEWQFDYAWDTVKIGMWLWVMSGWQHIPTQDEVAQYDQRWISDLQLAYQIYSHQTNKSVQMTMFEQMSAMQDDSKRALTEGRSWKTQLTIGEDKAGKQ